jgi:hypothetical protein
MDRIKMTTNLDFTGEVTNYGVHGIYSYPARFIPQIPRFFIEKYNPQVVMDPFGGSGTTAVEAKLHGCLPIHVDIMPVSFALCRVKTHEYTVREFHEAISFTEEELLHPDVRDAEPWMIPELTCKNEKGRYNYFSAEAVGQVMAVRTAIFKLPDGYGKDFLKICAGQCLSRVASAMIQASHWEKGREERHDFIDIFRAYVKRTRDSFLDYYRMYDGKSSVFDKPFNYRNGVFPVIINSPDASSWAQIYSSREPPVDLIVTSPPYGKLQRVVNYPEVHKFTHLFFFTEPSPEPSKFIQSTAELNVYMDRICSYLKPGGHCVVVVAPSCSDDWVTETRSILSRIGLVCCEDVERVIDPTRKYAPRQITKEWVLDWVKK